jgi:hypothetical protein
MQGMTAGAGNNPGGMNMSGMLGSGVINQAIKQSYAANQPAQNYIDNQIPIVWLAKQYIATGGDPSKIPPEIQKLIQQQTTPMAAGGNVQGYAQGGIAGIPSYAAGGKFLRGPGDGMSDSIPAMIHGHKPQQAALADGEFVIPADVVSHLGNGSSEAGSRKLYDMMDRIRKARTGRKTQGTKINPDKFLPR